VILTIGIGLVVESVLGMLKYQRLIMVIEVRVMI